MKTHIPLPTTVHGLIAAGFTGPDKGLAISLFEYNMAWRERLSESNKPEYQFLYRISNRNFDTGFFAKDLDIKKEFNWIDNDDWNSFLSFQGMTWEQWNEIDLPNKICDLLNFYGADNIFGSTYDKGIHITDPSIQES